MNLQFERVVLHNFLSYNHAEIDLTDKGYCLVKGINLCAKDNALSNGSGKSTFASAICWALLGQTVSGVTQNIQNIFIDEKLCYVKLTFSANGHNFCVTRYKAPKSDLKIEVDGEDKSGKGVRESEIVLAQYLPDLSLNLLASVVILGQGLPHKFSDNSPSGRKEVLEKLTRSDFMIQDLKERLTNRVDALNANKRTQEDIILETTSKIAVIDNQLTDLNNELVACKNKDLAILDENIAAWKAQVTSTTELIANEKLDLEKAISNVKILRDNLQEISEKQLKSIKAEDEEFNQARTTFIEKRYELQSDKKRLTESISQKKAIKDICPTCGQKIPGVIKPDTSALEAELQEKIEAENLLENKYKTFEKIHSDSVAEITSRYEKDINTLKADIQKLDAEQTKKNAEIKQQEDLLLNLHKSIFQAETEKENHVKIISQLTADIAKQQAVKDDLSKRNSEAQKTKDSIEQHLAVLSQMNTLIKRDFRGFLLKNIIEFIDRKAKEYAAIIFNTSDLEFKLNGNDIDIIFCKKNLEALSSGEKQKVNLIIQFAIRDMMATYLGFKSNLLILDEITDNLDTLGSSKLLDLISTKLSDVESIFIISHHPDELELPCDSELVIIKDAAGISRVKE